MYAALYKKQIHIRQYTRHIDSVRQIAVQYRQRHTPTQNVKVAMFTPLEDIDPNDSLTIDELVNTLLRAKLIDAPLADDLRERHEDDPTGDTVTVFCQFWRAQEMTSDPMYILRELELV
jgi:hypothetical protein